MCWEQRSCSHGSALGGLIESCSRSRWCDDSRPCSEGKVTQLKCRSGPAAVAGRGGGRHWGLSDAGATLCPGTAQGRFAEGRGMTMCWLQWSLAVLRMLLVWNRVWLLDEVVCYSGCAKVQHCNYNQKPDNVL